MGPRAEVRVEMARLKGLSDGVVCDGTGAGVDRRHRHPRQHAAIYDGLRVAPLENLTNEEWDDILAVNVRGVWNVTRAAVGPMRDRGYGKAINLASGTAIAGTPFHLHYVASKGAVIAMTRAMPSELGPDGIRVNALAPGLTDSGAKKRWDVPEERRPPRPAGPLAGALTSADLTGAAVFLASAESDAMTGQVVSVNLGTTFGTI